MEHHQFGRVTPDEASLVDVDAVLIDKQYASLVCAIAPDRVSVYATSTRSNATDPFDLMKNGNIATEVGREIFDRQLVLDARLDSGGILDSWFGFVDEVADDG